ncbi:MAG: hypothetical protein ACR2MQ_10480 [Gemmatimonadaceae bacterium]
MPAFELAALQRYLDLMDRNLEALVEQDPSPSWDGDVNASGAAFVAQLHHEVVSTMLPQVFRSSYALVLYATYEAAVTETADVLQKQHGKLDALPTSRSFLRVARKYFRDEFAIDLLPEGDKTTNDLHILSRVRNALVHANGRKGAILAKKWEALKKDRVAGAAFTLEDDYVRLEARFLVDMLLAVRVSLRALIAAARTSLDAAATGPNTACRPPLNLGGLA